MSSSSREDVADEEEEHLQLADAPEQKISVVYQRLKPGAVVRTESSGDDTITTKSFPHVKRSIWDRSLSTKGRKSAKFVDRQPQQRKRERDVKPHISTGDSTQQPNYETEKAYFKQVDEFELPEESPSPKKSNTWISGKQVDSAALPQNPICMDIFSAGTYKAPGQGHSSSGGQASVDFSALLTACGQSTPSQFEEILLSLGDPNSITKVGEGTFGEAFRVGSNFWKIVPFGGDLLINGEGQKNSKELLEEVVLSSTLNRLREHTGDVLNACTSFIKTIGMKVCNGVYDSELIRAWEHWNEKHVSENDNPKGFPADQRYVVFIEEDGGKDLENFVLSNFDEARSLLVQVTIALAIAEAAYEFEHRDLHWGNILLSRNGSGNLDFILEGKKIQVKTFGLHVSIIGFTLSRINTGENILFLDLSSEPNLFESSEADTYRNMKVITDDGWDDSFPKTNVLWLEYLVEILSLKKAYDRTSSDSGDLLAMKERLKDYSSAKECVGDEFFRDLLEWCPP